MYCLLYCTVLYSVHHDTSAHVYSYAQESQDEAPALLLTAIKGHQESSRIISASVTRPIHRVIDYVCPSERVNCVEHWALCALLRCLHGPGAPATNVICCVSPAPIAKCHRLHPKPIKVHQKQWCSIERQSSASASAKLSHSCCFCSLVPLFAYLGVEQLHQCHAEMFEIKFLFFRRLGPQGIGRCAANHHGKVFTLRRQALAHHRAQRDSCRVQFTLEGFVEVLTRTVDVDGTASNDLSILTGAGRGRRCDRLLDGHFTHWTLTSTAIASLTAAAAAIVGGLLAHRALALHCTVR